MSKTVRNRCSRWRLFFGLALFAAVGVMAYQFYIDRAEQTLPSPYWESNTQYFPQGPDMKEAKDTAAQAMYRIEI